MKIFFYMLSIWTMVSGMAAISMKNLIHCAIALVAFFAGIAALFFTLYAEFLGAVQLLVYVGAIAVLILFAIMLTRNVTGSDLTSPFSLGAMWGWGCSLAIGAVIVGYGLSGYQPPVGPVSSTVTVEQVGRGFMTKYAIPFEVISLLLTAAMIGAVVLALDDRRKDKK